MRQYSTGNLGLSTKLDRVTEKLTVATKEAIILKNIKHTTHLTEDKDSGALGLHRFEELIQDNHFTAILDEVLIGSIGRARFCAVK